MVLKKIMFVMILLNPLMMLAQNNKGQEFSKNENDADVAWEALSNRKRFNQQDLNKMNREERVFWYEQRNNDRRRFREEGLKFWYKFPMDPRRYDWLFTTREPGGFVHYYQNRRRAAEIQVDRRDSIVYSIPVNAVDLKAAKEWESIFVKLQTEFLTAEIPNNNKRSLAYSELFNYLLPRLNPYYREFKPLDLEEVSRIFDQLLKNYYGEGFDEEGNNNYTIRSSCQPPLLTVGLIYSYAKEYGITKNDLIRFTRFYTKSSNKRIREWAESKIRSLKIIDNVFAFKAKAMNGEVYDLKDVRGKVIFLDFWSLGCKSCIAAMPKLKKIYDEYKSRGFEVWSIANDPEECIADVQKVHDRIGADWPVFLIGGRNRKDVSSLGHKIFKTYGWYTTPQLVLIDKSGKVVTYNGVLQNGRFEDQLEELLAQDYVDNN